VETNVAFSSSLPAFSRHLRLPPGSPGGDQARRKEFFDSFSAGLQPAWAVPFMDKPAEARLKGRPFGGRITHQVNLVAIADAG